MKTNIADTKQIFKLLNWSKFSRSKNNFSFIVWKWCTSKMLQTIFSSECRNKRLQCYDRSMIDWPTSFNGNRYIYKFQIEINNRYISTEAFQTLSHWWNCLKSFCASIFVFYFHLKFLHGYSMYVYMYMEAHHKHLLEIFEYPRTGFTADYFKEGISLYLSLISMCT